MFQKHKFSSRNRSPQMGGAGCERLRSVLSLQLRRAAAHFALPPFCKSELNETQGGLRRPLSCRIFGTICQSGRFNLSPAPSNGPAFTREESAICLNPPLYTSPHTLTPVFLHIKLLHTDGQVGVGLALSPVKSTVFVTGAFVFGERRQASTCQPHRVPSSSTFALLSVNVGYTSSTERSVSRKPFLSFSASPR